MAADPYCSCKISGPSGPLRRGLIAEQNRGLVSMEMQTTVMVGWSKGWTSASHTYLVEVGNGVVWLGRLGNGGAYWGPTPGLPEYTLRQSSRIDGSSMVGGAAGMALGRAGARKVLDRYQAEIADNERRYHLEGRDALSGDKRTTEWPLSDFAEARLVDTLPATAPPALRSLGPGFVEVTLARKRHFFVGLPGGASAEDFHGALMASQN